MASNRIGRATALKFNEAEIPREGGRRAAGFIKRAREVAFVVPDEQIKTEPATGFCSPDFDGDRELLPTSCAVGSDIIHLRATQAERKVASSALRAKVGEEVRAQEAAYCRGLLARERKEIKRELEKRMKEKAPVAYSAVDLFASLAEGVAIVDAAPGSSKMDLLAGLFLAVAPGSGLTAVTAGTLTPPEYAHEPREPFHPQGQPEMFSDPSRAGAEFLTWLLVFCADGPRRFTVPDDGYFPECGMLVRPRRTAKLASSSTDEKSTFDFPEGGSVYTPELGEALLSGKLVEELGVEIAEETGGRTWKCTVDSSLSLSALECPAPADPEDGWLDTMRLAGRALGIVAFLFRAWMRGLRMDRERWAGFCAACRQTYLDAIGDADKLKRVLAKSDAISSDLDAIFASDEKNASEKKASAKKGKAK